MFPPFLSLRRIQNRQRRKTRRRAKREPTIPIEIAKSRSTFDESPCGPDEGPNESPCVPDEFEAPCVPEGLDEVEDAVSDVVPVLLLVCDVEEIVGDVSEESRTSKLSHIQSTFFPKR